MGKTTTGSDELERARDAAGRRDWAAAYDGLTAVDARDPLGPEDLELLAKASWWTGRSNGSIEARERAYAGYIERGDSERAAFCALTLAREYSTKLSGSVAKGWLSRAERLLEGAPPSASAAYLRIAHAVGMWQGGDLDGAIEALDEAEAIAQTTGDRDVLAWTVMRRGEVLFSKGDVEEGWKLLEEVAVAAVGGELGAYTTGAVFCNVISTCRERVDLARGKEWGDAAKRWCDRQSIDGFPGICRIRRAEIMRLLGALGEAEREIRQACEELPAFSPYFTGEALHELGEVRLRLGDLDEADRAFREAKTLGTDPQPGAALLLHASGRADAAAASIRRSLDDTVNDRLARARLLPAAIEIAKARGDVATVAAAADELDAIAVDFPIEAIHANVEIARGIEALLGGDAAAATARFAAARQRWRAVDAPYELARATALLAEALEASGDREGAVAEIETARATFERLGAVLDERAATDAATRWAVGAASGPVRRTFVFTDIVGSTALLEAIGDAAWADLRRWHDQTLRSCVEAHGGEEVDHTGDGFFLAFEDPAAAIACASDMQRRLAEHRRDHGFAPQVRIGVHADETVQTPDKYTGRGVHTAARIGALGGGGEIVASASTLEGLDGLRVSDRRSVALKGLAEPVEVVSIDW